MLLSSYREHLLSKTEAGTESQDSSEKTLLTSTVQLANENIEILVLLEGKRVVAEEADNEEGWVDILDLSNLPKVKLPTSPDEVIEAPADLSYPSPVELPLKRLFGKVDFATAKVKR